MATRGRAIKPLRNGRFAVKLSDHEREVLGGLPAELIKQMESGDDDGSLSRLFPPGYSDDIGRQLEYDRLMRDELQAHHIEALHTLADTAGAKVLDEAQLAAWMRSLNQLRLVLGTRLDVVEDTDESEFTADDPRTGAFVLYSYLGWLQDQAVAALAESL